MSKTTIVGAAIYLLLGAACATGGMNGGGDKIDASTSTHHDAAIIEVQPDAPKQHLDAGVVHMDAPQVSQTPDASTSGVFCTGNSQCTNAGECCVTLGGPQGFCGPGTVVLGTCVPQ